MPHVVLHMRRNHEDARSRSCFDGQAAPATMRNAAISRPALTPQYSAISDSPWRWKLHQVDSQDASLTAEACKAFLRREHIHEVFATNVGRHELHKWNCSHLHVAATRGSRALGLHVLRVWWLSAATVRLAPRRLHRVWNIVPPGRNTSYILTKQFLAGVAR
jgi:hypothetical protein